MIHSLANWMASVFVLFGESSEEDADIYAYACEAIISSIISMSLALAIAIILNRPLEGIVFTIVFTTLRRYTGGFHAQSHLGCILTYSTVLGSGLLILGLSINELTSTILSISIVSISLAGILAFAPVVNKNKPISDGVFASSKIKSRLLATVYFAICIIATLFGSNIGSAIALSMLAVFGFLIFEILYSSTITKKEVGNG